jgi:hypothetical protein
MKRIEIERIVRRGADSLAESIYFYWPSTDDCGVLEANIPLHLGSAFMRQGFLTYAEAYPQDYTSQQRIDLLAIHPGIGTVVACQFKRLQGDKDLLSLADDAAALHAFKLLQHEWFEGWIEPGRCYGLVAGLAWKREYAAPFADENDESYLQVAALDRLVKKIGRRTGQSDWGCREISSEGDLVSDAEHQWLVYAIFDLKKDP